MKEVIQNAIYEHYKGARYVVMYIAQHTDTNEKLVIYRPIFGLHAYARPYGQFCEQIYLDGKFIDRFKFIEVMV